MQGRAETLVQESLEGSGLKTSDAAKYYDWVELAQGESRFKSVPSSKSRIVSVGTDTLDSPSSGQQMLDVGHEVAHAQRFAHRLRQAGGDFEAAGLPEEGTPQAHLEEIIAESLARRRLLRQNPTALSEEEICQSKTYAKGHLNEYIQKTGEDPRKIDPATGEPLSRDQGYSPGQSQAP